MYFNEKKFVFSIYLLNFIKLKHFGAIRQSAHSAHIENISEKLTSIAGSLKSLNEKLENFAKTFSSNQGLRLTEKQQTILLAFELLNRSEQRLSILKLLKIDLSVKAISYSSKAFRSRRKTPTGKH